MMPGIMSFLTNVVGGSIVKDLGEAIHSNITTDKERIALENEAKKAAQDFQLKEDQIDADIQKAQTEVNKVEAASPHLFVAGWRPAVGWVGVGALILATWPKAAVLTVFWCMQAYHANQSGAALPLYPDLGTADVIMLLGSMLGIGTMRTYEKRTGVSTDAVRIGAGTGAK
jgi:holin (3TMs family)